MSQIILLFSFFSFSFTKSAIIASYINTIDNGTNTTNWILIDGTNMDCIEGDKADKCKYS